MKIDHRIFVGKTVFAGIDVHKDSYTLAVVADGVAVLKVGSMPALPHKLVEFLSARFPQSKIKTAYEAGFCGFALHRALDAAGFDSIVVNASSIEVAANDRVKTDKRDAQKIALQLSRGTLRGNHIPSVEEEAERELTRTRAQLVRHRAELANQIKSKLQLFGLTAPGDKRMVTLRLLAEIRQMKLAKPLAAAFAALAAAWSALGDEIDNLETCLREQAARDAKREAIFQSVPGVGLITARTLANELGDLSRFPSVKDLYSFTGLTPSEHSSGPKERKGSITRQGSSTLRSILVEAAWRAKRQDPQLAALYERIAARRGGKRAIVAVARNMIGRIRACLRDDKTYAKEYGSVA